MLYVSLCMHATVCTLQRQLQFTFGHLCKNCWNLAMSNNTNHFYYYMQKSSFIQIDQVEYEQSNSD